MPHPTSRSSAVSMPRVVAAFHLVHDKVNVLPEPLGRWIAHYYDDNLFPFIHPFGFPHGSVQPGNDQVRAVMA